MSMAGEMDEGGNGDEITAGEYVLGVLDSRQRREAARRIAGEPAFARLVTGWEGDLSSFNEAYEPTMPPRSVYARIEQRLFPSDEASRASASTGLWTSLLFWRGLTLASLLVVAGMAAVVSGLIPLNERTAAPSLVAKLSSDSNPVDLVAYYDSADGTLRLTPAAADQGATKSLELWMINGDAAPVSLGLLSRQGDGDVVVPENLRDQLGAGTVFAISLEPEGGSPSGQPTGPVVAAGPARSL